MIDAGGHLLGKEHEWQRRIAKKEHHSRHAQGKGDWHAGDDAQDKAGQHQRGGQRAEPQRGMQAEVASAAQKSDGGGAD
ncbi:hypothetical protein D3C81_928450 [compost metagenome]